ncbi:hypothetical protein [Pantoea stewartii]|uniref:hypothetical protein n=1 Tax=Pantoea stewartii TaxID=66269 RepID=UPI001243EF54|nr:hypothetical protein [Pantoea stewartii]KAB0556228.1 hypothetical protein F7Q90_08615 [Pantoea stewartii subsp. stewartii]
MLTDQQKTDVRRYAGYPMVGDTPVDDTRDFAYGWVSPGVWETLFRRLNSMSASEESVLINTYLTKLALLETAITDASDNLDTDVAAIWTHNKNEVSDRMNLFNKWRRLMCSFIGIPPGPWLGNGGTRVVRG